MKWALLVTVESPPATSEAPDRWEMSLVCVFTTFASAALLLIVVLMFSETESSQVSTQPEEMGWRVMSGGGPELRSNSLAGENKQLQSSPCVVCWAQGGVGRRQPMIYQLLFSQKGPR